MNLEKVRDVLAGVAPTVATALAGPFAGVATKMVLDAIGAKTPEDAVIALQADPQAIVQVRLAEIEFQKFMQEADIKREALVVEDRKDARAMSVAMKSFAPQLGITITLTGMIAWVIAELFAAEPPKGSENVLFILLGTLTASWSACVAFFVGTTSGSARKTDLLAGEVKK